MGLFDFLKKGKSTVAENSSVFLPLNYIAKKPTGLFKIDFYEGHKKDDNLAYDLIKEATNLKKEKNISEALEKINLAIKYSSSTDNMGAYIKLAKYYQLNHNSETSLSIFRNLELWVISNYDVVLKNHLSLLGMLGAVIYEESILFYEIKDYESYISSRVLSFYFESLSNTLDDKSFIEKLNSQEILADKKFNLALKSLNALEKHAIIKEKISIMMLPLYNKKIESNLRYAFHLKKSKKYIEEGLQNNTLSEQLSQFEIKLNEDRIYIDCVNSIKSYDINNFLEIEILPLLI